MTLALFAVLGGFIGLVWSADRFVQGAAAIARNIGMAPILIGLTIVAFGTSAPEIIVAISASLNEAGELAVGNAIGSNLANIGMVLGITALVSPIPVAALQLRRELPIVLVVTIAAGFLIYDNSLTLIDGLLFLTALFLIMFYLVKSKAHQKDAEHEADVEHIPSLPMPKAWLLFLLGLGLLILSSEVLVWGAKSIAISLGVSELIIGLTVIAVGTSLPELAATIASALKGHHDIALGNILGSNLFNLLAVMAVPAIISEPTMASDVFNRDYLSMTGITLLLAATLYLNKLFNKKGSIIYIGRYAGVLLLFAYGAYYYLLSLSLG